MNSRIALCAIALGATLFAADGAFAKSAGKAHRHDTIAMTRPSDAPDPNAQGTVDITHGRNGDQTVIRLNHLDPRTVYEIRDASTGAALGTAKTNRRGHATFDLTNGVAKSAAPASGSNGVRKVDVVKQATGDNVLTGDVAAPDAVLADGYADYSDDAGDSASVYMLTDPSIAEDTFSMTFYPAPDPNADPQGTTFFYYELNRDTADGDQLPLDVGSVSDLAGRAFEIHAADGTVVLKGDLPELTPIEDPVFDGNGDWNGTFDGSNFFPGTTTRATKSKKAGGRGKADAASGFSLFIADGDGVLQSAGELAQESFDASTGDGNGGCSGYEPGSNAAGFYVIVVLFGPVDGSFDFNSFFDQLLGGGSGGNCGCTGNSSGSGGNGTSDPSNGGADGSNAFGLRSKHHR